MISHDAYARPGRKFWNRIFEELEQESDISILFSGGYHREFAVIDKRMACILGPFLGLSYDVCTSVLSHDIMSIY